jgi:type IV pilus assembly protein PilV
MFLKKSLKKQKGSVLLETLIAVALFVIGVLGIMHLSGALVKQTIESKYRADASFYAQEVAGRMWADVDNVASYENTTYAPRVVIENKIKRALPNGALAITLTPNTASTSAKIEVTWKQAGEAQRRVVTNMTIAD